jgi:hypothetical protein
VGEHCRGRGATPPLTRIGERSLVSLQLRHQGREAAFPEANLIAGLGHQCRDEMQTKINERFSASVQEPVGPGEVGLGRGHEGSPSQ